MIEKIFCNNCGGQLSSDDDVRKELCELCFEESANLGPEPLDEVFKPPRRARFTDYVESNEDDTN